MQNTPQEIKLLNDIISITAKHQALTHEQQINKLTILTSDEKFRLQALENILQIKYNTVKSYLKPHKKTDAGNTMGNKIPLEFICKLCLHYNRSLDWFFDGE